MQIRQNQQFCAQMLHAHRRLGLACWGWLLLGSLLWLLELLAAALVLRIRNTLPVSLLTEQALLWRLVQLFWLVPAWLVWNWCSWSLWRRCTAVVSMLPHRRPAGRKKQLWLALQNTLLRTLLLQTVTLCLFGAYQLGKAGAAHTESAPYLFAAVQLLVLGTLCLLGWCYVCLGLWCVPFVCFARPELPAWKVPLAAMRAMHGGRKELLALLGWYGLQMLPVVTIPWVLPQAVLSVTVFCNLRVQMTAERTADGAYRSLPRYAPSDNWKVEKLSHQSMKINFYNIAFFEKEYFL